MAKNIRIFDISLETYTVREYMQFLEEFTASDGLNIVAVVSAYTLMGALEDVSLRNFLNNADLRIISDTTILEASEAKLEQQYIQIKKQELEEQFLKSLIRKKKSIYWVGENKEQLRRMEAYMHENYPDLIIAGMSCDGIDEDRVEHTINEINSADADVLFLNFSSPAQEKFLNDNKHLIHAKLCICMGERIRTRYQMGVRISRIKGLLDATLFKRKVMKYNSEKGEV